MANSQDTQDNSVMANEFDKEMQQQLADEDAFAWRSVTGLLIAIISVGLLIAILALVLAN